MEVKGNLKGVGMMHGREDGRRVDVMECNIRTRVKGMELEKKRAQGGRKCVR